MKTIFIKLFFAGLILILHTSCVEDNLDEFTSEEFVFRIPGADVPGQSPNITASFIGQVTSKEEGQIVDVPISLSSSSTTEITLAADIANMTAVENSDFSVVTSSITLNPGQTSGNFRFLLLADTVNEASESFNLKLRVVSGSALVSSSSHTVNILNKAVVAGAGAPKVSFGSVSGLVNEGQGLYNLALILDKPAASNVIVNLSFQGVAMLGQDFSIAGGNAVTIGAGFSSAVIPIQIIDDSAIEGDEAVSINITSAVNADNGAITSFNLTITDNDMAQTPSNGDTELKAFTETLYNNILRNPATGRCLNCHRPTSGPKRSPFHSHDDPAQALVFVKGLVNLDNPANSRIAEKVASGHNPWSGASLNDADAMIAEITKWSNRMKAINGGGNNGGGNQGGGGVTPTPTNRIASQALMVSEGTAVQGTSRYTTSQIAFYDLKKGADDKMIYDTSGVSPALNLTMSGDIKWLGGQGIKCNEAATNGKAQAEVNASKKLHSRITSSDQYTLEAWISSATRDQDGPTRIMSYSNGTQNRNFTMGQQNEYFAFRNRNADTDNNGTPQFEPQVKFVSNDRPVNHHVVMVYDGKGRKIYVNGALVDVKDAQAAAASKVLDSWSADYRFTLCNETTNDRAFKGTMYMAAVHDRALSAAQIQQNFDAGFTKKVALEFDISEHTNQGAKLSVVVDIQGKYLIFSKPVFKGLSNVTSVTGIKFAVNNKEAIAGQSYSVVEKNNIGNGQEISKVAALIEANDVGSDKISVHFSELAGKSMLQAPTLVPYEGNFTNVTPTEIADKSSIKLFSEIYQTFSNITGVDAANNKTRAAYAEIQSGLPTDQGIATFSSSHQINIVKLGYEFCSEMVANQALRNQFFGNLNTNQSSNALFSAAVRTQVANAIIDRAVGRDIATAPSSADVSKYTSELITELVSQGKNPNDVLVGACILGLSNMTVLIK